MLSTVLKRYLNRFLITSHFEHFMMANARQLSFNNCHFAWCKLTVHFFLLFNLPTRKEMVLLDNSTFIIRLEKFATTARKNSSFTVTFKRYNGHDRPKPREGRPPLTEPETYMCLMRAQFKSKKISTVVRQEDVPKMMNMYAQFMKSNMDGLKRVKKVKSKAKAAKG